MSQSGYQQFFFQVLMSKADPTLSCGDSLKPASQEDAQKCAGKWNLKTGVKPQLDSYKPTAFPETHIPELNMVAITNPILESKNMRVLHFCHIRHQGTDDRFVVLACHILI